MKLKVWNHGDKTKYEEMSKSYRGATSIANRGAGWARTDSCVLCNIKPQTQDKKKRERACARAKRKTDTCGSEQQLTPKLGGPRSRAIPCERAHVPIGR